jgi:hypothetical protein
LQRPDRTIKTATTKALPKPEILTPANAAKTVPLAQLESAWAESFFDITLASVQTPEEYEEEDTFDGTEDREQIHRYTPKERRLFARGENVDFEM